MSVFTSLTYFEATPMLSISDKQTWIPEPVVNRQSNKLWEMDIFVKWPQSNALSVFFSLLALQHRSSQFLEWPWVNLRNRPFRKQDLHRGTPHYEEVHRNFTGDKKEKLRHTRTHTHKHLAFWNTLYKAKWWCSWPEPSWNSYPSCPVLPAVRLHSSS